MRTARLAIAITLLSLAASPAGAITFGFDDEGAHPSVAAIIVDFDEVPYPGFNDFNEWCTSTLIHPRVVLTAAHCMLDLENAGYPGKAIYVSFQNDPGVPRDDADPAWIRVTEIHTHPDYHQNPHGGWGRMADPHDIALLVLEEEVDITPSTVAAVGFMDALEGSLGHGKKTPKVLAVGYGAQFTLELDDPPHTIFHPDVRFHATMGFRNLQDAWLITSQNPHHGDGGTCYGDSGGPVFWVDANGNETLVAITSWGDTPCVSMGRYYRADTEVSSSFIESVLEGL